MKTSWKTCQRLGAPLLSLSLFASGGVMIVDGVFAAPPQAKPTASPSKPMGSFARPSIQVKSAEAEEAKKPKGPQAKPTAEPSKAAFVLTRPTSSPPSSASSQQSQMAQKPKSAQAIPTSVPDTKGTQQTGGVGSFFSKMGSKVKQAFKPHSDKPEVAEQKKTPASSPSNSMMPQGAPSQVTRNNPMRPNVSLPSNPTEPNKLPAMSGTQTNEVMKQLEELYKADGRVMPDMGPLRDSHAETAAQIKKVEQKSTVLPSELSDSPLDKARAFIPGMNKPIETPKLVDKPLPQILPETRVTDEEIKASLPAAPRPAFVPTSPPEVKVAETPKPIVKTPIPSTYGSISSESVTPQTNSMLTNSRPVGKFPDPADSVTKTDVKKAETRPAAHPLAESKAVVAPVEAAPKVATGMFPDPVSSTMTAKTIERPKVKSEVKSAPKASLGSAGKFPDAGDVAIVATPVSKVETKSAEMDEDHFFILDTEEEEDLDLGNDLLNTPTSSASSMVKTEETKAVVEESKSSLVAKSSDVVKVEPSKVLKTQDVPLQAEVVATDDSPFLFPEGGIKAADEELEKLASRKMELMKTAEVVDVTKAVETKTDVEAVKPKEMVKIEDQAPAKVAETKASLSLPPVPEFPDEMLVEAPLAPKFPGDDELIVSETTSKSEVPAMKADVAEEKMEIDEELVIEGDPAFEEKLVSKEEKKEEMEVVPSTPNPTSSFVIPPLPGTADEVEVADVKPTEKASEDEWSKVETSEMVAKKVDVPALPATSDERLEEPSMKDDWKPKGEVVAEKKVDSDSKAPMTPEEKYALISSRKGLKGFKGFCSVALRDRRELVDTDPEWQVLYNEKLYYFSSMETMQKFEKDPERYLPANGGQDVVIEKEAGFGDEGMLDFAVWYHGKLYLFASKETMIKFSAKPSEFVVE